MQLVVCEGSLGWSLPVWCSGYVVLYKSLGGKLACKGRQVLGEGLFKKKRWCRS